MLAKLSGQINNVILFGSQATNNETQYSDFDVLIILNNKFSWQEKVLVRDICYDISLEFGILIDSKIISNSDIEHSFKGTHPLIEDALNYGIYA